MALVCGTSGFSYNDWKGNYYPDTIKNSDMLGYYVRHFKAVEINVTYYTIPPATSFEKMHLKTPDDFEFVVKVNQNTTHIRKENENAVKDLLASLQPLAESNKLAGLLAQFPFSFHNNEKNRKYLLETRDLTGDIPLFVEFRHDSWLKNAIPDFLSRNHIAYVNVDEPSLQGLLPAQNILTGNLGYVRFHGRNKEKWWDGTGSERYDYNYSTEELQAWLVRISEILKKSYKTYVFFNNHPRGNAPANALLFQDMIKRYLS